MAKTAENILKEELGRQADIYHDSFRIDRDAIMRLLYARPDYLPKYLTVPVVTLGTRVSLKEQADFAGIGTLYDLSRGHDTAGGITFGEPHLEWMQDGSKYLDKSVDWVRNYLAGKIERPATQYDGVALGIVTPDFRDLLRKQAIDLPGTTVGFGSAPYLSDWFGGPRLHRLFVVHAGPDCGSASCGS